jgi:hypothetical protein
MRLSLAERLQDDHRDLPRCSAAMIRRPPRISLQTPIDVSLPFLADQLSEHASDLKTLSR